MSALFGSNNAWRGAGRLVAAIAAAAMKEVFPETPSRAVQAELAARKDQGICSGHCRRIHDSRTIDSNSLAHWVVRVGEDLYDPAFWQLCTVSRSLSLSSTPYFFEEDWFSNANTYQNQPTGGIAWAHESAKAGLNIEYVVREEKLMASTEAFLMGDEEVRAHARMVRVAYGPRRQV